MEIGRNPHIDMTIHGQPPMKKTIKKPAKEIRRHSIITVAHENRALSKEAHIGKISKAAIF